MQEEITNTEQTTQHHELQNVKYVSGMYQNWFLDYASYVILERAVPHLNDGLKPVQRRILHSMKRMDDGRYNKVANIIGFTMQFHPHGDASIGDALVQLGQKDLLIDCQGNWGNIYTGDSAAAPRYIEARLSKFALDVVFNPKTTEWKLSYDGRNKEPITLPMKFPLLLAQGVEGIAVGLASKILPHNFNELLDACIAHLRNEDFELYPDFLTGGLIDVTRYNEGMRGGKVRVRARIRKGDKNTLVINDIPFGTTTTSLIESIIAANDKGKIKVKKIDDNTAENVEIVIHLLPGTSPDITMDALYAFTDCEVSISPNSCTIEDNKPKFLGVKEMLRRSVENTKGLLKMELDIRKHELNEDWHLSSLEKIFIENRLYLLIEKCETWEAVLETIDKGLDPWKPKLRREVTHDDIIQLTEIKIKRISKYDAFKADEHIKDIEKEIKQIDHHLAHLVDYTIAWYSEIKKKYGKDKDRKTEIRSFDVIEVAKVVIANEKLYINREDGFIGTGLKKDEYLCDCSDLDEVIFFRKDGTYVISKVQDKLFIGSNPLHVGIFRKNDERTVYNAIYSDGETGICYIKRFSVSGITRDKEYNLTQGTKGSKVLYFTANPNGEAEKVRITLKPRPRLRNLILEADFSQIAIKGRSSMGNIVSRNPIHKVVMLVQGTSTLGGQQIWFDHETLRLNKEGKGDLLGEFHTGDRILAITKNGTYQILSSDLSHHFEPGIERIEKYVAGKIISAVYYDADAKFLYVKRFQIEELKGEVRFIGDNPDSQLRLLIMDRYPRLELVFGGKYNKRLPEIIDVTSFIGVKGVKAKGCRLTTFDVETINRLEPIITEDEVKEYEQQVLGGLNEPEFEVVRTKEEPTIF